MIHLFHRRRDDGATLLPGWRQDGNKGWGEIPTTDAPTTYTRRDALDPWWPEVSGLWVDGKVVREVREQR